jgi:hypothetical protein
MRLPVDYALPLILIAALAAAQTPALGNANSWPHR